jgi:hypothetical protein
LVQIGIWPRIFAAKNMPAKIPGKRIDLGLHFDFLNTSLIDLQSSGLIFSFSISKAHRLKVSWHRSCSTALQVTRLL